VAVPGLELHEASNKDDNRRRHPDDWIRPSISQFNERYDLSAAGICLWGSIYQIIIYKGTSIFDITLSVKFDVGRLAAILCT
jgi:hypothetical protein